MNADKSVLVLSQDDVEQDMTIQVGRQKPNFVCQSYNNSLILTNVIMQEDPKDEFVLVFLNYFPESSNLLDDGNEELFDSIIFDFKGQKENETATVEEFIEKSTVEEEKDSRTTIADVTAYMPACMCNNFDKKPLYVVGIIFQVYMIYAGSKSQDCVYRQILLVP
uniref:Uncharacterized protein n=1 Tax=Romanomermis culicivorax TaxID=13658 RepID=A0A915IHT9_ROMCU